MTAAEARAAFDGWVAKDDARHFATWKSGAGGHGASALDSSVRRFWSQEADTLDAAILGLALMVGLGDGES